MPDRPEGWLSKPSTWIKLKAAARENRHKPTHAEDILWQRLRARGLNGYKFRRQHSIGSFLMDFYRSEANLGIEIDGYVHRFNVAQDKARQNFIEASSIKVIRFTNDEIINSLDEVLVKIGVELQRTSPSSLREFPLSVDGEGIKRRGK